MRTFKILLTTLLFWACSDTQNENERKQLQMALSQFEIVQVQEEETIKFIEEYLIAITKKNWKEEITPFLEQGEETDAFLEQHAEFRKSFPNYTSKIQRIAVDGNEAIAWLEINANYMKTYDYEKGFEVVRGIAATGQPISWQEAWYFNVVDGKFGDKWAMLKDNYKILNDLKVQGLPTGYSED